MKKNIITTTILALFLFAGCIKNDPVIVSGAVAEFDATALNSNAAGLTYPILGRNPGYGRVANTTDSTLRRYVQTIRLRVNLVGAQSAQDQTVGYSLFTTAPITTFAMPATISGQTPAAAAATLNVSLAASGTDFTALSGILTIPKNSSFGFLDLPILAKTATAGEGKFVGITLNNAGTIKASVNYSQLGLVIDQR
ncbi:hypothetical protein [Ferruginibacter sp.]